MTNDAGERTDLTVRETLDQRETRYGSFEEHANIAQQLKNTVIYGLTVRDVVVSPFILESIEMICHKLGRIANGDPYYDDSWRDIAGYAQLVVDILNKDK